MFEILKGAEMQIFLVLELVTGGELFERIVEEQKFDDDKARRYFRQLVEGVEHCHKQGVCHRDLKPENLLVDGEGNLRISDFGLSALYAGAADGGARTTVSRPLLCSLCHPHNPYLAIAFITAASYHMRNTKLCGARGSVG